MFADFAPKYWAAGLPVMPLRPGQKIPALNAWQVYCTKMPSEAEQEAWLRGYPDGNMGLPLGPGSGLIVVDLDSDDPRVQKVLDQLMPHSPWKRVGKKGAVYAFKYSGERTYRIKDDEGRTIMEVLSTGAQVVLPPSIHPDTLRPYEANCELVEVLDKITPLPPQFESQIRQALIDAGLKLSSRGATKVVEWVPAGGRDSAMVAMAGLLARGVLRKERTLMEALTEMEAWIAEYTEKVVGDAMEPDKGKKKVLEFLRRDIVEGKRQLPSGWDAGMTPKEIEDTREFFGEDAEEWEIQQILDHLTEGFQRIPRENVPDRQELIENMLYRVSRSEQLTSLEVEQILNFISIGSGRAVNISALRKRLVELRQGEMLGLDHTEIAQALLRDMEVEGEVRFDAGHFYQWYGAHWRQVDESEINTRLATSYGSMSAARKFSDHKGIIALCQRLANRPLADVNVPGINFANGYLTDDMQLVEHDPRYGATYVLPYRYVPDGAAPSMFMGFLDSVWGQDDDYLDKVQALREAIAITLFKQATRFQRAFCLFGPGESGKSTMMKIILGLIPDNQVSNVPPHDWADKFLPTRMHGKLINNCGELSESVLIPGAQFKLIVEGSAIEGQYKGRDIFSFRPLCAQWFMSNFLPRSRDTSNGFNRRWLIFKFNRKVSQKREGLAEDIISEEREAIAAWAIPAIQDVIRRSEFTLPASHHEQIAEVAAQNNNVRFFLTTSPNVRLTEGVEPVQEAKLYQLYYAFCKLRANTPPVSMKRFRVIMEDLQAELKFKLVVDRSNGLDVAMYDGVEIVAEVKNRG